jgi:small-conductance mechanosensitive channel
VQDSPAFQALSAVLHYCFVFVGVLVAFQTAGVKLSALLAAGAALAVGAGFGLQNAVQNLVSGVILMLERSVRRGDILEVEGVLVRVEEVRIRSTVAVSRDGEHLILPNSTLVQTTIKNLTFAKNDSIRLRAQVGVHYSSDLKLVAEALDEAARACPWRDRQRSPQVLLTGFGSSSVDFDVAVWTRDPWEMRPRVSELREQIWWALKRHDITIAFPQVDVHFDAALQRALLSRAAE